MIRDSSANEPAEASMCEDGCRVFGGGQKAFATLPRLVRSTCDRRRKTRSHILRRQNANRLRGW